MEGIHTQYTRKWDQLERVKRVGKLLVLGGCSLALITLLFHASRIASAGLLGVGVGSGVALIIGARFCQFQARDAAREALKTQEIRGERLV